MQLELNHTRHLRKEPEVSGMDPMTLSILSFYERRSPVTCTGWGDLLRADPAELLKVAAIWPGEQPGQQWFHFIRISKQKRTDGLYLKCSIKIYPTGSQCAYCGPLPPWRNDPSVTPYSLRSGCFLNCSQASKGEAWLPVRLACISWWLMLGLFLDTHCPFVHFLVWKVSVQAFFPVSLTSRSCPEGFLVLAFIFGLVWSAFRCCVKNTLTVNNLGSKGFTWFLLPDHSPSLREVGAGPRRKAVSGLVASSGSTRFLVQSRTTYLGTVPPTVGWASFSQLAIKTMPRHVHRPICPSHGLVTQFSLCV